MVGPRAMSTTSHDYYQVLGVSPTADVEVVRAAYRALAKKSHPDAGGDPDRFKAIEEAHRILTHPDQRAEYDAERRWEAEQSAQAAREAEWRAERERRLSSDVRSPRAAGASAQRPAWADVHQYGTDPALVPPGAYALGRDRAHAGWMMRGWRTKVLAALVGMAVFFVLVPVRVDLVSHYVDFQTYSWLPGPWRLDSTQAWQLTPIGGLLGLVVHSYLRQGVLGWFKAVVLAAAVVFAEIGVIVVAVLCVMAVVDESR